MLRPSLFHKERVWFHFSLWHLLCTRAFGSLILLYSSDHRSFSGIDRTIVMHFSWWIHWFASYVLTTTRMKINFPGRSSHLRSFHEDKTLVEYLMQLNGNSLVPSCGIVLNKPPGRLKDTGPFCLIHLA